MKGKLIMTYEGCGRYEFQVWEVIGDPGPCYVTTVRSIPRENGRGPPSSHRTRVQLLLAAMKGATSLASRLQHGAKAHQLEQGCTESPRPSPAPRLRRSAARPLPLDGLLPQTIAGGGCAEPCDGRSPPEGLRVLSRSEDSVGILLSGEEAP